VPAWSWQQGGGSPRLLRPQSAAAGMTVGGGKFSHDIWSHLTPRGHGSHWDEKIGLQCDKPVR